MKLGLENCLRLNALLNFPDRNYEVIHVAGTNGKGSVTKKVAAALEYAGRRVGRYTSPHISCFRERVCINGKMISEQMVEKLLNKIFRIAEEEGIPATFFELTTLMALDYFSQEKVDVAVLETGLGGRLDATNIVTPKLAIITSISLEHTEILGDTLEKIAREKAGVIKTGIPVVLGPCLPKQLLEGIAKTRNSPCVYVSGGFPTFEEENCAIAKAALELLNVPISAIKKGLAERMPCRLEIFTRSELPLWKDAFPEAVILDVAHNPDGLLHLFEAIGNKYPGKPLRALFGISKTKDIATCLEILQKNVRHIHLVEAPNGRGAPIHQLKEMLCALGMKETAISIGSNITESVLHALKKASEHHEITVVCGTFFIMEAVRSALGVNEPRDPIDINERR